MKIINFVTVSNETMASYRYHNLIPSKELRNLGYETDITNYPRLDADVCCFSKHFNLGDYFYLRGCKSKGIKTVFHVCDNHFDGKLENHYRLMINEADKVIASTDEMAKVIKEKTGRDSKVIYDACEFEQAKPKYEGGQILKLLWFGHPTNLNSLMDVWPKLKDQIMIITAPEAQGKITMNGQPVPVVSYSKENLLKALDMCDAVIIPSELGERQKVKSPNRLVEAARRGKYVLADKIPSYMPFDEWMWIGDIPTGIEMLKMNDSKTVEGKISKAQEYIERNHSPKTIGKQWEEALRD